jgi:hypothetical protein
VVLEHADLLKALEHLALDSTRGVAVVRRAEAAVLRATVQLLKLADTDRLAQVDVARKRSCVRAVL